MAGAEATALEPNGANGTMPPLPTNGMGHDDMTSSTAEPLSAEELALYDRQIRLWGAQAQKRIQAAHILLISLRALGTEIAKNLTLAGLSSITIVDNEPVTEEDLGSQYFLRAEDVGKPHAHAALPRIQELNPRVAVKDGGALDNILMDQNYYLQFDCIIACDLDFTTTSMINTACRVASRPFYAAGIHGFYGYIFADLFSHEFVVEREKSNIAANIGPETLTRIVVGVTDRRENTGKTTEIIKKSEIYCPLILANSSPLPLDIISNRRKLKSVPALLPCLRALFEFQRTHLRLPGHNSQDLAIFTSLATTKSRELQLPPETLRADFLRSFIQNIGAEIVPTAAFVGGRLSEDVINVLGKREQPIQNFALFDGDGLDGRIYCLYTPPPELTMGMDGGMGMDGMGMQGDMGMGMPVDMGMGNGGGAGFMDQGMGLDGGAIGMNMPMDGMVGTVPQGLGVPNVTAAGSSTDAATAVEAAAPPTSAPANGDDTANLEQT